MRSVSARRNWPLSKARFRCGVCSLARSRQSRLRRNWRTVLSAENRDVFVVRLDETVIKAGTSIVPGLIPETMR